MTGVVGTIALFKRDATTREALGPDANRLGFKGGLVFVVFDTNRWTIVDVISGARIDRQGIWYAWHMEVTDNFAFTLEEGELMVAATVKAIDAERVALEAAAL